MIIAERSDAAVRAVVDLWITKLCDRDFEGALALLIPRTKWNATLLETVIRNYGFIEPRADGRTFEVTTASGEGPRFVVEWFGRSRRDGAIAFAEIDLPLNGVWSDVTATFNIVETEDGLRLALEDVHVL